jgi:hypothetical protein
LAASGLLIMTRRSKPAQKRSGRPERTMALASFSARSSAPRTSLIMTSDSAFALPSSIWMSAVVPSSR